LLAAPKMSSLLARRAAAALVPRTWRHHARRLSSTLYPDVPVLHEISPVQLAVPSVVPILSALCCDAGFKSFEMPPSEDPLAAVKKFGSLDGVQPYFKASVGDTALESHPPEMGISLDVDSASPEEVGLAVNLAREATSRSIPVRITLLDALARAPADMKAVAHELAMAGVGRVTLGASSGDSECSTMELTLEVLTSADAAGPRMLDRLGVRALCGDEAGIELCMRAWMLGVQHFDTCLLDGSETAPHPAKLAEAFEKRGVHKKAHGIEVDLLLNRKRVQVTDGPPMDVPM